jgi:hypothetical protein
MQTPLFLCGCVESGTDDQVWKLFNGIDLTILSRALPQAKQRELGVLNVATSSCTAADGVADSGVW